MRPSLISWLLAAAVTALVAAVGALTLPRQIWGPPEQPPRAQGEAQARTPAGRWSYRADLPDRGIREPQNTWTNLAYVFVGAVVAVAGRTAAVRVLGVAMFFLGVGSGLYHASATDQWRLIDIIGMYWTIALLALVGWATVVQVRFLSGAPMVLVVTVVAIVAAIFRNEVRFAGLKPFDSTYVTVAGLISIATCLFMTARRHRSGQTVRWSAVCLALAALAIAGRVGDEPGRFWFSPDTMIQGHAVWHVASAGAATAAIWVFSGAAKLDQTKRA